MPEKNEYAYNLDGLLIPYSDDIRVYQKDFSERNRILATFKRVDRLPFQNANIKFSDDQWDFRKITNSRSSRKVLHFEKINTSSYKDLAKYYVLNRFLTTPAKVSTVNNVLQVIRKLLTSAEKSSLYSFEDIPLTFYKSFFKQIEYDSSYRFYGKSKRIIKDFIAFFEYSFNAEIDKAIKEFINEIDIQRENSEKLNSGWDEIPIEYFNVFRNATEKIMRDEKEKIWDRMTAAELILYSQIGCREEELFSFKCDSYQLGEDGTPYFVYEVRKSARRETVKTVKASVNKLSLEAYNIILELGKDKREKLKTDDLIVTERQKGKHTSPKAFNRRYEQMILRHWKLYKCVDIMEDYPELQTRKVKDYFVQKKVSGYLCWNMSPSSDWMDGLDMDSVISYPSIHQFRVTFANYLRRQGHDIYLISQAMNHAEVKTTSGYFRTEKKKNEQVSEDVFNAIFNDKSKLLGVNSDPFVKKVVEFIEENHIDIENDIDAIKKISKEFPLVSKTGGVCIKCARIYECDDNDITDKIWCWFNKCPNHCHMYFNADYYYSLFKRQVDIIKTNEQRNRKREAEHEYNKLVDMLQSTFIPEMDQIREEIHRRGKNAVIEAHENLKEIIENYERINKEVEKWMQKKK